MKHGAEHPATVLSTHDGDTITVRLELGLGIELSRPLRLFGLNCPELPTPAGIAAKGFTAQWIKDHPGPWTYIQAGDGSDTYGRLLGSLRAADGHVLNDDLLAAGQAVVMKE